VSDIAVSQNVKWHLTPLNAAAVKTALVRTYRDVQRNHTLQMAAALSYYFVLSFFPALILLSAVVAYLPVRNLFERKRSSNTPVQGAEVRAEVKA
jgi:uncharacterized BrkB/YihY/UPF0761 family membrane protein